MRERDYVRYLLAGIAVTIIGVLTLKLSLAVTSTSNPAPSPSVGRTRVSPTQKLAGLSFDALLNKSGVYGLGNVSDVPLAASSGIQLTLTPYKGASDPLTKAIAARNMYIVDSYPEGLLYARECPGGNNSCLPLSAPEKQNLFDDIKTHVQQTKDDPQVAAYYLLDDYWGDFSGDLHSVYQAIRSVDTRKPTVCAFSLDLGFTPTLSQSMVTNYRAFQLELTNYSPEWCNVVAIYSYGPNSAKPLDADVEDRK